MKSIKRWDRSEKEAYEKAKICWQRWVKKQLKRGIEVTKKMDEWMSIFIPLIKKRYPKMTATKVLDSAYAEIERLSKS